MIVLLVAAVWGAAGCARRDAHPAPPAAALDSGEVRRAAAALAAYLDASREGSPTHAALDSLTGCDAGSGPYLPISMLATYTLLPTESHGDTVVGRAVVVTVAEQSVDPRRSGHYLARQRVRADTLEWDVVPDDHERWTVCNGLQFGYLGPDSLTEWRPPGTSYATARALADSIGRASRAER